MRGKRIRVASYNRLVITKNGYRIVRGPAPLPRIDPDGPAGRLSPGAWTSSRRARTRAAATTPSACTSTSRRPSCTSIALGRGPHHNLGNDGKPHKATWRGVMPALARAGGVWLEMYHSYRGAGVTPMTSAEWRAAPGVFSRYLVRFDGDPTRLHI